MRGAIVDDSLGILADFLVAQWTAPETVIYPAESHVFRALELTPLDTVRAVILGQDPYPTKGQAAGLAFSVPEGCSHPLSLRKILVARQCDLRIPPPRAAHSNSGHGTAGCC